MIIKTKAWKNGKSGKLLHYIVSGALSNNEGGFTLYHNASYPSLKGISEDFDNLIEKTKTNPYIKNYLNHHILALSPEDNAKVNSQVLEQVTTKYLQESGLDRTTCLAKAHRGKNGGYHVHIMAANVPVGGSNKSLRISKQEFDRVRFTMEHFQLQEFDLTNSVVHLNLTQHRPRDIQKEDQNKRRENEFQARTKTHRTIRKDFLKATLTKLIANSSSFDDLLDNILQTEDLEIYHRASKPYGVSYQNQNYRFKTLGLDKQLTALDRSENKLISDRFKALEKLSKSNKTERNLGRNK